MEEYFSYGVGRVVLGTAALENRAFLDDACASFPEKIFVGVDVKQGKVALHGWTNLSEVNGGARVGFLDGLSARRGHLYGNQS